MNRPIRFGGVFAYREYQDFLKAFSGSGQPERVEIDLSQIRRAHAAGMAPLIATIDYFTRQGWIFDVVLPDDARLAQYFERCGWEAGITGDAPPSPASWRTHLPLHRYKNHTELNPLLNDIMEHLATSQAFQPGVLDAISWSLHEIADNVLNHAGKEATGWVQMIDAPSRQLVELVVVDCGQGITSSLRQAFPGLLDDREAVMKAIEQGVTRDPNVGQGNGLAGTIRIAGAAGGYANVHSGLGEVRIIPGRPPFPQIAPRHHGTLVTITLPTDKPIDVADALWGHEPMSDLEMRYVADDGSGVTVTLLEESTGFGNRASARPIRMKLHNLMTQYPTDTLTIDFAGVTLISASFADELIARLVKEMGPTRFFSRVRLVNLSELARRTIDAVIAQRVHS